MYAYLGSADALQMQLGGGTPKKQVVFCVMPSVPERYVLEQTTVCAQDLASPDKYLLVALVHGPRAPVLQPWLVPWEEVSAHVLQPILRHGC